MCMWLNPGADRGIRYPLRKGGAYKPASLSRLQNPVGIAIRYIFIQNVRRLQIPFNEEQVSITGGAASLFDHFCGHLKAACNLWVFTFA